MPTYTGALRQSRKSERSDKNLICLNPLKKVAILIPVYNAASTVGETLRSLQNIDSGWDAVDRILICDDCSNDDSIATIRATGFDRCPVSLIRHKQNRGEAACYMTMLEVLPEEIEWFIILHADDKPLPCFLKRNLEILGRCSDGVATVSSNYYVFDSKGERLAHSPEEDIIVFRGGSTAEVMHTAEVGSNSGAGILVCRK
jgi:glycosyltransferase involved in cell wall biosynthesis